MYPRRSSIANNKTTPAMVSFRIFSGIVNRRTVPMGIPRNAPVIIGVTRFQSNLFLPWNTISMSKVITKGTKTATMMLVSHIKRRKGVLMSAKPKPVVPLAIEALRIINIAGIKVVISMTSSVAFS